MHYLSKSCRIYVWEELCKTIIKTHTASVRDGRFFSNRVINVCNSLPDSVVSSATVTGFKLKLMKSLNFLLDRCSDALTVSLLCNLGGASIRAGLLPWCPDQHIFRHRPTVFSYILLVVFHLSSVCLFCFYLCCQIYLIDLIDCVIQSRVN